MPGSSRSSEAEDGMLTFLSQRIPDSLHTDSAEPKLGYDEMKKAQREREAAEDAEFLRQMAGQQSASESEDDDYRFPDRPMGPDPGSGPSGRPKSRYTRGDYSQDERAYAESSRAYSPEYSKPRQPAGQSSGRRRQPSPRSRQSPYEYQQSRTDKDEYSQSELYSNSEPLLMLITCSRSQRVSSDSTH